jgi:hypothetical protein
MILTILIVGLLFLIGSHLLHRSPTNLGPQLQFVSKQNYGCYFFCDSSSGTSYYYATSLQPDDLGKYFVGASCKSVNGNSWSQDELIDCTYKSSDFIVTYYGKSKADITWYNDPYITHLLQETDRRYVITIDSSAYVTARAALTAG